MVNNDDIHMGLFTPDIRYPSGALKPDEIIFFSACPRPFQPGRDDDKYGKGSSLNGKDECIERIHVTGAQQASLLRHLRGTGHLHHPL
jgi:hypothetical protein